MRDQFRITVPVLMTFLLLGRVVVGFRFADRAAGKLQDKQWYQTDILELTPLAELPADLKP